jgi:hypothetical protein
MFRDKLNNIVNFIKQPRNFVICAKNDKIIFIPPSTLSMINERYFDEFFQYDFVDCKENKKYPTISITYYLWKNLKIECINHPLV